LRVKKYFLAGAVLVVLGCSTAGIMWSTQQRPDFYVQALQTGPPPEIRKEVAREVVVRTLQLVEDMQYSPRWSEEFTEAEVNSWLAEEFTAMQSDPLFEGVRDPRIKIANDALHVAFRLDQDGIHGIVSCELRPRIGGPNRVDVAVSSVRVGLLPIPVTSLIDDIYGHFAVEGWRIRWYPMQRDTVIVNLDRGDPEQPVLEELKLVDGRLRVAGSRQTLAHNAPTANRRLRVQRVAWSPPSASAKK
jgi:hypothetical protein